jgi:hypothetical protein
MRSCLALWFLAACVIESGEPDEDVAETAQEGVSLNGVSLNGVSLNGVSLNGVSLNGVSLNGVSLNGVSLDGTSLKASTTGAPLSGTGVVGSTWTGALGNGASLKLRVDSAQQLAGTNSDVWAYGISYQTKTGWSRLCADTAVPVAGVWSASAAYTASTSQFTFACRNTTIAKCVELGYKPYKGYANQLASCTRLLRGDYCGTGVPYTADGSKVNLYDNVGVQKDTQPLISLDGLVWTMEGEWGPNGARCVANVVLTRFLERRLTLPPCVLSLVSLSCGSFRPGTYLLDEIPLLQ